MLPKEIMGHGIPEKSSDWTCIEKKVRGIPPSTGAVKLPGVPVAITAVAEEGCVEVWLLVLDCARKLSNEATTTKASEMVDTVVLIVKVTDSLNY